MRQSKRALRRHHLKRLKTKWFKKTKPASYTVYAEGHSHEKYIGMLARTRSLCSCRACGNTRKWEGDKPKEKSFTQLTKSELDYWV